MKLAFQYAIRDLRGALSAMRIVLICLILGVASIACVQVTSHAVLDGIQKNGREILGGDMIVRTLYQPAPEALRERLEEAGARFSDTVEARVMLSNPATGDTTLVELKAVDGAYPLYGAMSLDAGASSAAVPASPAPANPAPANPASASPAAPPASPASVVPAAIDPLAEALAQDGIVLDPALRGRLDLAIGDQVRVGEALFTVASFIAREPDRAGGSRFGLAPRAMIDLAALEKTGFTQNGAMLYYDLRVRLPQDAPLADIAKRIGDEFAAHNPRIRDANNASPQVTRFVERMMLFLTLVGLSALLIGGIGIGNGLRAYLETRLKTIAILKMLGARRSFIERIYAIQIGLISSAGILAGIITGAALPFLAAPFLQDILPFPVDMRLRAEGFLLPALFGLLIAALFSLLPLGRAIGFSPLELFRSSSAGLGGGAGMENLPRNYKAGLGLTALLLAGLAIGSAREPGFALSYVIGAGLCLLLFWLCGKMIALLAGAFPVRGKPALRLALRNLSRPGNATANTLISLGLGLTVIVGITLVEMNLRYGIAQNLPADAPAFFFMDIQGDQKEAFAALVTAQPSVHTLRLSPNLRGRIVAVNGVPAEEAIRNNAERWLLQNDRGFTYTQDLPAHSEIMEGEWWPADYAGPPLVSVVDDVQKAFGVHPGDRITVNIMGRDITAEIANVRSVNWMNFTINFAISFAPGTLEAAPHTWLATIVADPANEAAIQRAIGAAFPNISMIRLSDAVEAASGIMGNIAMAARLSALVAIVTGIFVLAGSLAATRMQRLYDTVVLKVLGVRKATLLAGFLFEFCLLGFAAAFIALFLGAAISWAVMAGVMELGWSFYALPAFAAIAAGMVLTLLAGWIITGRVLSAPPAPYLRNE
ncbi:MAG: FtsX-like permease family protein [Micavibrio sp.]